MTCDRPAGDARRHQNRPNRTEAKRLQTNTVPAMPENLNPPKPPEGRPPPPRKKRYFDLRAGPANALIKTRHGSRGCEAAWLPI